MFSYIHLHMVFYIHSSEWSNS